MFNIRILFVFIFLTISQSFYYHLFNINTKINKSIDDSLIHFIKINNVNYLRIKNNHPKYLILKYFHDKPIEKDEGNMEKGRLMVNLPNQIGIRNETEHIMNFISMINHEVQEENEEESNKEIENKNYGIYEIIRNNNKPILILYEKKNNGLNFRHLYLIKYKYNYISKYSFDYRDNRYKYYFDIKATEINKYETNWNITARFRYNPADIIEIYKNNIINWINYNIYNNLNNYYYKRYLLYKDLHNND